MFLHLFVLRYLNGDLFSITLWKFLIVLHMPQKYKAAYHIDMISFFVCFGNSIKNRPFKLLSVMFCVIHTLKTPETSVTYFYTGLNHIFIWTITFITNRDSKWKICGWIENIADMQWYDGILVSKRQTVAHSRLKVKSRHIRNVFYSSSLWMN